MLAAMTLAYSINLFGSITHYASGQAAIFYGSGFMSLPEVRISARYLIQEWDKGQCKAQ